MAFPKKPITEDEQRTQFLRLFGVPDHPRIYVLGCFARYATVQAQQVRALNLVSCLAKGGILTVESTVAVVGGGIAGLTAAAGLAALGLRRVVVYEREDSLLKVQKTSEERYLHPNIYDWPAPDALDDRADLPLLGWKADQAAEVAGSIDEKWRELTEAWPERLETRPECGKLLLRNGTLGPEVGKGDSWEAYDVVILAVGFGSDNQLGTKNYWTGSSIDGADVKGGSWLVSGAGDGALTDLMRLCIKDFRHKRVLQAVDEAIRVKIGKDLLEAESSHTSPDQLVSSYKRAAKEISEVLSEKLEPRGLGKVYLNCTEEALFASRTSVLNRLICAWLLQDKRFTILTKPSRLLSTKPAARSRVRASFEDPKTDPRLFDHVIARHGTTEETRIDTSFPNIYKACETLEQEWKLARQREDWTKDWLYEKSTFDPERSSLLLHPHLPLAFGAKLRAIVIGRGTSLTGRSLSKRVRDALERFSSYASSKNLTIDTNPVVFDVKEVFSSSAAYERLVRALCRSPIAIFDITDFEPAVLLLLGIRAAARRAVTVTVSEKPSSQHTMPFNLAALNPIRLDEDEWKNIAAALQAGFEARKSQPLAYLDLPAYDALRKLGEDHRELEPATQVLFLRWFDTAYRKLVKGLIEAPLDPLGPTRLVTSIDSSSPQLVEQRLYAAIRRTRLCVADWTAWRPNVFFEIGVRLAVNKHDPIFILYADAGRPKRDGNVPWPKKRPRTAALLTKFFAPTLFTLENDDDLRERFARFLKDLDTRQKSACLSPGRTFAVVQESIDPSEEPGGVPVHKALIAQAREMVDAFVPEKAGSIRVLFKDSLGEQARIAALESLLASWFYLRDRFRLIEKYSAKTLAPEDHPFLESLSLVWRHFSDLLEQFPDPRYAELRQQLASEMQNLPKLQESDDVVEKARALKSEAMALRKERRFEEARVRLRDADAVLESAVSKQRRSRLGEPVDDFERTLATNLVHIRGTLGGVWREEGRHLESAKAYDAAYELERPESGYGIVDSYALVQRLVARVFLDPSSADNPEVVVERLAVNKVLTEASATIENQMKREGRDRDEYARGDFFLVQVLIGGAQQSSSAGSFLELKPGYSLTALRHLMASLLSWPRMSSRASERLKDDLAKSLLTLQ